MAQAAVSFVVGKLGNLLVQEAIFLYGVHDQIEWVKSELEYMQSFLKDADSKRDKGDERVRTWVREVRDVAYEAENLVDVIMAKIERRRQKRGFAGYISRYSAFPSSLITRHKVGMEIERLKGKIREIKIRRETYGITNLGESSGIRDDALQALRHPLPHLHDDKDVVGFEDDTEALLRQLLDPENKQLSIISIVGMGGAGKTTLARRLYNRPQIKGHFETFAWVVVSQEYNVHELLNEIVKEAMRIAIEDLQRLGEGDVRLKLIGFLQEKKYLIVLDDVWKPDAWANIREVFPDVHNGSRVMLTTRKLDVAQYADSRIPPHEVRLLNDDESWELFCRKAFPKISDKTKGCPIALKNIGQQLARKCGGLPLALVVLGGLLSTKPQTHAAWRRVYESIDWEFTGYGQNCSKTLALSYNDLPDHHLKSCFLYFSSFPEDSTISVNELTRLWIAEGFVPQRPKQMLEERARCYLEELVQRCMIQAEDWSLAHGWVKTVRIHDLLRDLCILEANKDGFLNVWGSHNGDANLNPITAHRVAMQGRISDEQASSLSSLHTLLGFELIWTSAITQSFSRLQLLRVIDLKGTKGLRTLPKEIMSLIHLRYLGLRDTDIESLPSSTASLYNLQTLDVRNTAIGTLPKQFWKIPTLRHVRGGPRFPGRADASLDPPPRASMLKNLQTLGWTKAGSWMEKDLTELTEVSGPRKLLMDGKLGSHSESLIKLLRKLDRLAVLILSARNSEQRNPTETITFHGQIGNSNQRFPVTIPKFSDSTGNSNERIPAEVLTVFCDQHQLRVMRLDGPLTERQHLPDSTQFPPNLTRLELRYSQLEQDPMEILEKLPNLLYLYLYEDSYCGKKLSCSTGGFRSLLELQVIQLRALEEWRVEVGAMPSLISLAINSCNKLKTLPEGLQHVTTLQQLFLYEMPEEFRDRVRQDGGEDLYKIPHLTTVTSTITYD